MLLEAASAGGRVARERAEELVRLVVDLYGAGLERLLEIVHEAGRLDDDLLAQLAADDLVAGLLAVHGLHPDDVADPGGAGAGQRPALSRLARRRRRTGRPHRRRARAAADARQLRRLPVVVGHADPRGRDGDPRGRPRGHRHRGRGGPVRFADGVRHPGDGAALAAGRPADDGVTGASVDSAWPGGRGGRRSSSPGSSGRFSSSAWRSSACRVGADLYAYRDRCRCEREHRPGGTVARRLGGAAGDAVLRCPACAAHFDVRRAGRGWTLTTCIWNRCPCWSATASSLSRCRGRWAHDVPVPTVRLGPRASPLAVLRRIPASRPAPPVGERCEMCAEPIDDQHQHVVDLAGRGLMCTCRPCYLLFTAEARELRYRAVPDRYLSFPGFALIGGQWDDTARSRSGSPSSSTTRIWAARWRSTPARPEPRRANCRWAPGTASWTPTRPRPAAPRTSRR